MTTPRKVGADDWSHYVNDALNRVQKSLDIIERLQATHKQHGELTRQIGVISTHIGFILTDLMELQEIGREAKKERANHK